MNDENDSEKSNSSGNNKIAESISAVTGLVKAVPIYQDAFQPAARELGKGLAVIAKSVNVALAPLSVMVWGYEKIQEQFLPKVAEKLKDTKPEDIITPKPNLAVPAIEALRYTAHDESLSDLFAGLLASAMDKNKADKAHPSFVEIIKQLTSDEAIIIDKFGKYNSLFLVDLIISTQTDNSMIFSSRVLFSNFTALNFDDDLMLKDFSPSYINNLCRLGLTEVPESLSITGSDDQYELLENHPIMEVKKKEGMHLLKEKSSFKYLRKGVRLTDFGRQFISACIYP